VYLGILKSKHVENSYESVGSVSDCRIENGHGSAGFRSGRADGRCVLTCHLGLVVYRIVGIGAERARHAETLEAIGSPHNGRHRPTIKGFG
jgi:hypothetical protein